VTAVLVTGGAGFIGSHVCDRLLAEGHKVVAVDDLSSGRIANLGEARGYGKDFTFLNMDVRAEGLAGLFDRHKPQVVMHLAAQTSNILAMANPVDDASTNIMGLLNILEASVKSGVEKVVYASSGTAIYGEPRKLPLKETSASGAKPLSPQGVANKAAEEYLRYYQRYRSLDFTVLALGTVYGPRQVSGAVAVFVEKMIKGEQPTVAGDGNQTRDFVYVDDTVHAFALALEGGSGKLINIGTGVETPITGLARMIADITGFTGRPIAGNRPHGEPRRIALDNALASSELGWKPWTHLEDGLGEMIAFIKGV
jgi:UDP-glucose 4-epimerase